MKNPAYIVLLFVLLTGIFPVSAQSPAFHVLLKGKVTDNNGKPLAHVPVTDGTNIVYTNTAGEYRLESTQEAMFVYLTIPAGYEIPVVDNMALFYQAIKPVKGIFTANFTLKPLTRSDKRHFTLLWADPQINNQEEADLLHATAVPDTRELAQQLLKLAPVQGIAAGDLSWDAPPIIPEYRKAIKNTGIPFFQVLGNHDMDINVRSDEQSDSTFRKSMGPTWYSFNRGQAHYIVLDNVFYYSDGYNYLGYITEKQFRWLEQDLRKVKPGSLVFVSMHISAYTNEKARNKAVNDHPGAVTVNRKFLYNLLKPFNTHFLTGHTHYHENILHDNIYEHIHAAVCGTWWISPLCGDGTPRGYGVFEINGDSVSWYYKSIGYDKNYQLQAYNRGSYRNRPQDIAANVWNYDEAWKVEWYEDNVFKGPMRRETAYDARVVEFLKGPSRPAKYPWAQPLLTDHLFFATPSEKAKAVRIVVTDRFGNKYEEQLNIHATQQ